MRAPILLAAVALCFLSVALAAPPVVTELDKAQAQRIASMPDGDPVARFNQLLAARQLSEGSQFALASTHPGIVEQLIGDETRLALSYLESLPAPDMHRVRRGETVIRTKRELKGLELGAAEDLVRHFGFKIKKLTAVRVGSLEGRFIRVEVTAGDKSGTLRLAWPSTPERDEESRNLLTKHYGARPTAASMGAGAHLPLEDGSFETESCIGTSWTLVDAVILGTRSPAGQVTVDAQHALDGGASLRFYADQDTRLFPAATQAITIAPGTQLRAAAYLKTDNIRREFQQSDGDLYLSLSFDDITGSPLGEPALALGRASTHKWEQIEVTATAPAGAAYARVSLFSGLSGTAWFDGVTLQIAP